MYFREFGEFLAVKAAAFPPPPGPGRRVSVVGPVGSSGAVCRRVVKGWSGGGRTAVGFRRGGGRERQMRAHPVIPPPPCRTNAHGPCRRGARTGGAARRPPSPTDPRRPSTDRRRTSRGSVLFSAAAVPYGRVRRSTSCAHRTHTHTHHSRTHTHSRTHHYSTQRSLTLRAAQLTLTRHAHSRGPSSYALGLPLSPHFVFGPVRRWVSRTSFLFYYFISDFFFLFLLSTRVNFYFEKKKIHVVSSFFFFPPISYSKPRGFRMFNYFHSSIFKIHLRSQSDKIHFYYILFASKRYLRVNIKLKKKKLPCSSNFKTPSGRVPFEIFCQSLGKKKINNILTV